MAREFGRWFRFYDGVLDDPKVQRLPDKLFRAWVNLMCLASRGGGRIEADYAAIGFSLRLSEGHARDTIKVLAAAGLMDIEEGVIEPHNWPERQFKSDVTDPTAAERMRRMRERNGAVTETVTERNDTVTVTPTRAETEQIQSRTEAEQSRERSQARAAARGTRWPTNAVVLEDWIEQGAKARVRNGLPAVDLRLVAEQFADYWAAESGKHAVKLDWRRTWLKWATSQKVQGNGSAASRQPGHRLGDFGEILEREHNKGSDLDADVTPRGGVRKAQGSLAGDDRIDGGGVAPGVALLSDRSH